jgi:hypothetical protein
MSTDGKKESDISSTEKIKAWCQEKAIRFPVTEFFSLPPEEKELCLAEMVRHQRADLLQLLKDNAASARDAKAVRKAVHKLRSQGLPMEEKPDQRRYILPGQKETHDMTYATMMGPDGIQVLWIYLAEKRFLVNSLISDQLGIKDFIYVQTTKKKFERLIEQARAKIQEIPIIRIPPEHALWLISRGRQITYSHGLDLPQGFHEARPVLGALLEPSLKHPVEQQLDIQGIRERPGILYDAEDLLQYPYLSGWLFSNEALESCRLKLKEAEASPLVMNEAQQKDRIENIFEDEARKALEKDGIEKWKFRLLENAYLLLIQEEKEMAEKAAATALALEEKHVPPFFKSMMKRSFQTRPTERNREDRIIIP